MDNPKMYQKAGRFGNGCTRFVFERRKRIVIISDIPLFFKVSQTKRHVKQGAARFGANALCVSGTALGDMYRFKANSKQFNFSSTSA
jgi:hypothetical protein